MRVLVVSDIHGNLGAIEAVLAATPSFDAVWNLGDTVGYGPQPAACLRLMRDLGADPMLAGNHDLAAIGRLDPNEFNPAARAAALWTGARLTAADRDRLAALPSTTVVLGYTLAHGSPRGPVWEYVVDAETARANGAFFATNACLVGHSHIPLVAGVGGATIPASVRHLAAGEMVDLTGSRRIVNPGSVGQPRDGDPRAAFALLDTDAGTFTAGRVRYDVAATQAHLKAAGLPTSLSRRLALGR